MVRRGKGKATLLGPAPLVSASSGAQKHCCSHRQILCAAEKQRGRVVSTGGNGGAHIEEQQSNFVNFTFYSSFVCPSMLRPVWTCGRGLSADSAVYRICRMCTGPARVVCALEGSVRRGVRRGLLNQFSFSSGPMCVLRRLCGDRHTAPLSVCLRLCTAGRTE